MASGFPVFSEAKTGTGKKMLEKGIDIVSEQCYSMYADITSEYRVPAAMRIRAAIRMPTDGMGKENSP